MKYTGAIYMRRMEYNINKLYITNLNIIVQVVQLFKIIFLIITEILEQYKFIMTFSFREFHFD